MKESEWIVSPKQLKEHQKKAFEAEEKKREIRKERIANIATIIAVAIAFIILGKIINRMDQDFISQCTAYGNSQEFCERAVDGK